MRAERAIALGRSSQGPAEVGLCLSSQQAEARRSPTLESLRRGAPAGLRRSSSWTLSGAAFLLGVCGPDLFGPQPLRTRRRHAASRH